MSRWKASYCVAEGLGPLVLKGLCQEITSENATFTVLFDETTTVQVRRQMDILIRFWSSELKQVETRYLTSMFMERAPSEELLNHFKKLMSMPSVTIPWSKFRNASSDSPAVNKKLHKLLHEYMADKYPTGNGLLPFIPCTLHVVHNAFYFTIIFNNNCIYIFSNFTFF